MVADAASLPLWNIAGKAKFTYLSGKKSAIAKGQIFNHILLRGWTNAAQQATGSMIN